MTSVTHWLPTQRNGRGTEEELLGRHTRQVPVPARTSRRRVAPRGRRRSMVGFVERRVGASALLTLGLLVVVGVVVGLLLCSVLLHALALLGMQPSQGHGSGSSLVRALAGWTS